MNWLDFVLIAALLVAVILGSKVGLVRSIMRFIALAAGIIIATNNSDIIAVEIARQFDASPMVIAILSFVVLLLIIYAVFRIVAFMFYKVSKLHSLGRTDKVGGAMLGAVRGWVFLGFIFFLITLMPVPDVYYRMVDGSSLTGPMMRTITVIYDGTSLLHPANKSFITKVESSLVETNKVRFEAKGIPEGSTDRQVSSDNVKNKIVVIQKYFGPLKMRHKLES